MQATPLALGAGRLAIQCIVIGSGRWLICLSWGAQLYFVFGYADFDVSTKVVGSGGLPPRSRRNESFASAPRRTEHASFQALRSPVIHVTNGRIVDESWPACIF